MKNENKAETKKGENKMKMLFIQNAASGKVEAVTVLGWFNAAKTYRKIRRASGSVVSVPADLLFAI